MMTTDVGQPAVPGDATRVRNQPSLTSSTGAIWLIVGGLLAATGIAILAPMIGLGSPGIAVAGITVILVVYAAMVIVKLVTRAGRIRLGLLAIGMVFIAIAEFASVGVITATEWNVVG